MIAALILAVSLLLATAGAEAARPFDGETIRIQMSGGPVQPGVQKYIIKPFEEATGARFVVELGWTAASVAKLRAQKNDPQLDIVMFDDIGVITAAKEGLLEPLDLTRIPNAADVPKDYVFDGKGIGFFIYLNSLAYNRELLKEPPRSWRVLWEPRFRGKVVLPSIDSTSINNILIMAARLNGGSQTNIEPGFEALARLKPNIHSLEKNAAVLAENLRSGEAVLATWQPSVFKPYIEKGYPIATTLQLEEGIFGTPGCVAIVKGHKTKRNVLDAFINRALSAEAQEGILRDLWYSPTNRKVKVPAELRNVVFPVEGRNVQLVPVDVERFYRDKPLWLDRLNKTLLQ